MFTYCKIIVVIFLLVVTGMQGFVFIDEFLGMWPPDVSFYPVIKVLLALFIFNIAIFVFALKYKDTEEETKKEKEKDE